jgi:ankyrin repeat domain-containing protein 50
MGALLIGLQRTLYLIDRFKIYEILYLHDGPSTVAVRNFTAALTELYAVILRFLIKAIRIFSANTALRAVRAFFHAEDVVKFENECQKWETQVEIEANNCDRSCSAMARADITKLQQLLNDLTAPDSLLFHLGAKVSQLWDRSAEAERTKILSWTSSLEYEDHHTLASRGRTGNTGTWLLEHDRYEEWSLSDQSMILWLHGIRKVPWHHTRIAYC